MFLLQSSIRYLTYYFFQYLCWCPNTSIYTHDLHSGLNTIYYYMDPFYWSLSSERRCILLHKCFKPQPAMLDNCHIRWSGLCDIKCSCNGILFMTDIFLHYKQAIKYPLTNVPVNCFMLKGV